MKAKLTEYDIIVQGGGECHELSKSEKSEEAVSSLILLVFLDTLANRKIPWFENDSESGVGARFPG
jgi:hypothetical protein